MQIETHIKKFHEFIHTVYEFAYHMKRLTLWGCGIIFTIHMYNPQKIPVTTKTVLQYFLVFLKRPLQN